MFQRANSAVVVIGVVAVGDSMGVVVAAAVTDNRVGSMAIGADVGTQAASQNTSQSTNPAITFLLLLTIESNFIT
ncbi:MAG: hypothetical protein BroJett015_43060 [Chloroflexota bacterium]|nr:MAG: hypothetical protein BroJett015_43060 [Chloroflexota bacterium]